MKSKVVIVLMLAVLVVIATVMFAALVTIAGPQSSAISYPAVEETKDVPYTDNLPTFSGASELKIDKYNDDIHYDKEMSYKVSATPDEVLAFYRDVLGKGGWINSKNHKDPNVFYFEYPDHPNTPTYEILITITTLGKGITNVEVDLNISGLG